MLKTFSRQGIEGVLDKKKELNPYWIQPEILLISCWEIIPIAS